MSIARKLLMSAKNRFIPEWITDGIPPLTSNGQNGDVLYGIFRGDDNGTAYSESQSTEWNTDAYKAFNDNFSSGPYAGNQGNWRSLTMATARYFDPKGYSIKLTSIDHAGWAYQVKEFGGPAPSYRALTQIIPVTGRVNSLPVTGWLPTENRAATYITDYNFPNPGAQWSVIDTIAGTGTITTDFFDVPPPTYNTPFYLVFTMTGTNPFSAQYPNCFTTNIRNLGPIITVALA